MSRRQIGINKTQIRDKKIRQLAETFKGKNLNLNNNKSSLAKVLKNANEKPYYMDNAEFEKMKSLSVRALRGILK